MADAFAPFPTPSESAPPCTQRALALPSTPACVFMRRGEGACAMGSELSPVSWARKQQPERREAVCACRFFSGQRALPARGGGLASSTIARPPTGAFPVRGGGLRAFRRSGLPPCRAPPHSCRVGESMFSGRDWKLRSIEDSAGRLWWPPEGSCDEVGCSAPGIFPGGRGGIVASAGFSSPGCPGRRFRALLGFRFRPETGLSLSRPPWWPWHDSGVPPRCGLPCLGRLGGRILPKTPEGVPALALCKRHAASAVDSFARV